MRARLKNAGIDLQQLKTLLRLAWRLDMRRTRLGFGLSRKGKKPVFTFIFAIAFYFFFGIVFAVTCYKIQNNFVAGMLITGIIMLMMAAIMLIEYNAIIIAPEDYAILGYMPVSSQTYFWAKLINLLFYTLTFSTILGGPTAIVLATKNGFSIIKLLATSAGILGSGLFITLLIANLYTLLLKIISPTRLKRLLSYLQFTLAMFIYVGYLFIPRLLAQYTASLEINKSNWWILAPNTWFTSVVLTGHGQMGTIEFIGMLLAVCSLIFLGYLASFRLSLSYAQKLSAFENASTQSQDKPQPAPNVNSLSLARFFPVEMRVVAKLLRGQFRHDMRFRFSVLSILPILLVYFYLGLQQSTLSDPFLTGSANLQDFGIFFFAILMMPMIMKKNVETSTAFSASWIFYTTPVELPKIVLASRNLLFALFSLPGLVLVFFIFAFYFANPGHAFLHAFTLLLLCFLFLQIVYFFNPKLPFSEPKTRGAQSKSNTFLFLFLPAAGLFLLHTITTNFYVQQNRLVFLYFGQIAVILLVEKLTHLRIRYRVNRLNFENARD